MVHTCGNQGNSNFAQTSSSNRNATTASAKGPNHLRQSFNAKFSNSARRRTPILEAISCQRPNLNWPASIYHLRQLDMDSVQGAASDWEETVFAFCLLLLSFPIIHLFAFALIWVIKSTCNGIPSPDSLETDLAYIHGCIEEASLSVQSIVYSLLAYTTLNFCQAWTGFGPTVAAKGLVAILTILVAQTLWEIVMRRWWDAHPRTVRRLWDDICCFCVRLEDNLYWSCTVNFVTTIAAGIIQMEVSMAGPESHMTASAKPSTRPGEL